MCAIRSPFREKLLWQCTIVVYCSDSASAYEFLQSIALGHVTGYKLVMADLSGASYSRWRIDVSDWQKNCICAGELPVTWRLTAASPV
jgi:hypothetical protein